MAAKIDYDKMDIVLAVYSSEEADDVTAELLMERIPCARRKIGAGKTGNFLMAMNNYGEEIFVNREDMERAKAVIEAWREKKAAKRAEEATAADREPAEEDLAEKRRIRHARFYAVVVLVIVVLLFIYQNR